MVLPGRMGWRKTSPSSYAPGQHFLNYLAAVDVIRINLASAWFLDSEAWQKRKQQLEKLGGRRFADTRASLRSEKGRKVRDRAAAGDDHQC
jgi:hypothetical protein